MKTKLFLSITLSLFLMFPSVVRADDMQLMRVTCYCPESCSGNVTASGTKPKANYTCGARRDLIGCVALVYEQNAAGGIGDFVGLYMIEDTGSAPRIEAGNSIDVYQDSIVDARSYVRAHGDYMWVQIVRGEG